MRILIVDDSLDERLLISRILKDAGCGEIVTAASARQAFEQLGIDSPTATAAAVDVILMDIRMPDVDGIEACRRIKADERYRDVPILIVSARDRAKFLEDAFKAGALDYISKPLDQVELLVRVRSAIKLKQEVDHRKSWEEQLTKSIEELHQSLRGIDLLKGIILICSSCKKIRNGQNTWQSLEEFIQANSKITFSYDLCTDCCTRLYPDTKR
ncbi:MAG: response regulator [Nitrospiraceae bacterium]